MNTNEIAIQLFENEMKGIEYVKNKLDNNFVMAVDMISDATGDVVIVGIGKTGIIGQKIVASMTSTGTRAFFLNAAEGMHGDLGIIRKNDVVIIISNSGNTQETTDIIAPIKRIGAPIIAMTGNKNSILAKESTYVLDIGITDEGCPIGLAPLSSTTATLIMGDALTVALMSKKQFTRNDFAIYHPGGSLGRHLLTRVSDLMTTDIPKVEINEVFKNIIYRISEHRLGMTLVYDGQSPVGIITDGDIRRNAEKYENIIRTTADQMMTKGFLSIGKDEMATCALEMMQEKKVTSLAVIDKDQKVCGIVTIHQLIKFK